MAISRVLDLLFPAKDRNFQPDLAVVSGFSLVTIGVVLFPIISETPLRYILVTPFVLFFPGYTLVSALFPEDSSSGQSPRDDSNRTVRTELDHRTGIDNLERLALSVGTSIAIVPFISLVLNFTPWGIRLVPITLSIAGFTVLMAALAARRRWELPQTRRYSVPYWRWIASGRSTLFGSSSRRDVMLSIGLTVSVLCTVGSVAYVAAVPADGETFSELYLLTENDDGELVAEDYPQELVVDEPEPLVVGVQNHEGESTRYTVVIEIQELRSAEDGTDRVVDRQRVDTLEKNLDDGDTWRAEHSLVPTTSGQEFRVAYLLYIDEPPAEPTTENAYRSLQLSVTIDDSG